jgi:hypothetical protein
VCGRRNNTAIGWFLPNVFLYPAGFTSEQLTFVNTSIRHFVVGPQIANAMGVGLLDGDKQTFLLDLDGSLTGYASTHHHHLELIPLLSLSLHSADGERI